MRAALLCKYLALTGYGAILLLIILWNAWLAPSEKYPTGLILIILLIPLLIPLRGLLHGRPYTYAWVSMLSLLYFILGVSDAYSDPVDRIYGWLMIAFSLMLFCGAILFVYLNAKTRRTG